MSVNYEPKGSKDPNRRLVSLSRRQEIGKKEPLDANHVHLTTQEVAHHLVVKDVVDVYPVDLVTAPTSLRRLITPEGRVRRLLEERGVEFDFAYIDNSRDPFVREDSQHKEKVRIYKSIFLDPAKTQDYELLKQNGNQSVAFTDMYMSGTPMSEIAERHSATLSRVQIGIGSTIAWAGGGTQSKRIITARGALEKQLAELKNPPQEPIDPREEFRVEGGIPPDGLPVGRWRLWQHVISLPPKILDELKTEDPLKYQALAHFLYIIEGVPVKSLNKLGAEVGLSGTTLSNYKNKLLARLGIR